MSATPPGWYDDGHGALRWWDGRAWTEHVATPDPEPAVEAEPAALQPDQPVQQDQPTMAYPPADLQATQVVEPVAPVVNPFAEGYVPVAGDPAAAPPYATASGGSAGYPGGYPGAYPGGAPGGAFMAATEPKKSRAWIVWVIVGAVLLGFVILAAVLIPLILFVMSASSSSGSSGPVPAPSQSEAVEVQATTEDEAAAVATIELYNDAWLDADCDTYYATTTEAFRSDIDLADCASFEEAAAAWGNSIDNYDVTVVAIEISTSSAITIRTSESYDSWYDEDGDPVVDPVPVSDEWIYDVISRDGAWVIDGAY